MELLRVRAAAAVPGFELTPENLSAVATLVRRLDGLPLAIELAAVRLRTLTVEQITARLDDRFKLLDGSRTPVRRHQTLRSAIDWSHKLCGPQEQLLWARLTVFSGSFDLAAAERICADEPATGLAVDEIVDRLGALVEKSIVYAVPDTNPYRFRMLDTIRDYGAERLSELGESHTLRRRHRDHYASLVRQAERAWTGHDQVRWFECLRGDYANVWAALDFCLNEPGELATGQDMAARLWFFWIACGFLREGRHYLEKALAQQDHHPDPQRDLARRKAMWACAFIAGTQGDLDAARELATQCHADASAASDTLLTAYAVETQGMVAAIRGDLDQGVSQLTEALDYYRGLDEIDAGLLRTMPTLGVTLVMRGDLDGALALARECRPLCEAHGELWQRSYVDYLEGLALRGKGDPALATARVRPAVEVKLGFHDIVGLVMCIELLAGCAADLDDGPRAGRLLGATLEIWRMFGLPAFGSPFHSTEHQRSEERARELLGESGFERALQAGRGLSLEEVVAYAVGQSPRSEPRKARAVGARPVAPSTATTPLTRREAEIADLVAQGLSNRDIAARLVIAKRTVDSHVEHILVKLGFSARTQIAAWAVSHRDADPGGRLLL
jgi:non-specific serine/threonine protein kinase